MAYHFELDTGYYARAVNFPTSPSFTVSSFPKAESRRVSVHFDNLLVAVPILEHGSQRSMCKEAFTPCFVLKDHLSADLLGSLDKPSIGGYGDFIRAFSTVLAKETLMADIMPAPKELTCEAFMSHSRRDIRLPEEMSNSLNLDTNIELEPAIFFEDQFQVRSSYRSSNKMAVNTNDAILSWLIDCSDVI